MKSAFLAAVPTPSWPLTLPPTWTCPSRRRWSAGSATTTCTSSLGASVRSRIVFIVQTLAPPVNDHLVELLMMLDIARSASAKEVHAIIPYYSFARSDKKDAPRISITARLVADLLRDRRRHPRDDHGAALAAGARLFQRPDRPADQPSRFPEIFPGP